MTWGYSSFPRAILHVDGDSFFAACEIAKNPKLVGKPVITGKERGIVSACTYDLKARGITRGMRVHEAKKIAPDAIVLPSDYETYSLFAERMYSIVRRYTPAVEEYSIDECFADLTGMRRALRMNYRDMAHAIKRELGVELGITFSVGISATKTLAKVASKWDKPDGFRAISLAEAPQFLAKLPVEKVWGIGSNTALYLNKFGVTTAKQFIEKPEAWVREHVSKPFFETWRELKGELVFELAVEKRDTYQSIAKTKTFTPPSTDRDFVFSQLSKNVENACIKARRWNLASPRIMFFLKTQDFHYHACEVRLPHASSLPHDILREVGRFFPQVYRAGSQYRSTGITLMELQDASTVQLDLFGVVKEAQGIVEVFKNIDAISKKYGKHAVFLGSSFDAMKFGAHLGERGDTPERTETLFRGESSRRRLAIPMLGEVG